MSFKALSWAWQVEGLDPMQRLCLLAVAEGAQHDGTLKRPCAASLVGKLHVSPRYADNLLATLFEAGLCEPSPLGEEYCRLRTDRTRERETARVDESRGGLR
ncbi:hypothetical protein [Actinomyces trachealis]|uniref:hypothetical protein n=1 Tax=Actinomyces trachealis TaxID=2763540 RepID=UPI001892C6BD|nr:hypothetical protein [Actinomyces trachealis]